jgi:hypothetical protein
MHRMFNRSFTDLDASLLQLLMNFADTAVLSIAQSSHQGNDVQPTFSMWKRQSSFFFWTIGLMIPWALLVPAAANH